MSALRLLIVDDEVANLKTFQRVFRKQYEIATAPSGAAALAMLAQESFDVVLSDFGMPEMSGAELVARLRSTQPVAVVMVTGYMSHPDVLELEETGAIFGIVPKPWDREAVADVIARASEHTRRLRATSA